MSFLRRFALGVVCLAVIPALVLAQDIAGVWVVTIQTPDGPVSVDATFQPKGETVIGQIDSPVGMVDFVGTFVKGELAVTYTMDVRGRSVDVEMSGVLENGTLSGYMNRTDMGEVEWTAKRKPSD